MKTLFRFVTSGVLLFLVSACAPQQLAPTKHLPTATTQPPPADNLATDRANVLATLQASRPTDMPSATPVPPFAIGSTLQPISPPLVNDIGGLPLATQAWLLRDLHIFQLAFSPAGDMLAVASSKGILVYNVSQMSIVEHLQDNLPFGPVAWSPDGTRLAGATYDDQSVMVWDSSTWQQLISIPHYPASLTWSPDGKQLAGAGIRSKNIFAEEPYYFWDAETWQELSSLQQVTEHQETYTDVVWSPDGRRLAGAGLHSHTTLWDAETGTVLNDFRPPPVSPEIVAVAAMAVSWSPDGQRIATVIGKADGDLIVIYEAAIGEPLATLNQGDTGYILDSRPEWSPDGSLLAIGTFDGTVRLWRSSTWEQIANFSGLGDRACVTWLPNSSLLAIGTYDGRIILWDTGNLQ